MQKRFQNHGATQGRSRHGRTRTSQTAESHGSRPLANRKRQGRIVRITEKEDNHPSAAAKSRNQTGGGTGISLPNPMIQAGKTAMAAYQEAFRNGLKMQQQATQWWTRMLTQGWFANR